MQQRSCFTTNYKIRLNHSLLSPQPLKAWREMKGKPGHTSGSRQMTSRSPVTHRENSLYWPCLTRERGKKNQLTKIKNEDQSVVVRLKDTQLHQPSSLWASHKASLCLKLGALEQEMSTRLGLSQGGAQRDVVFWGLYPSVRTYYSMPPFPLRSNMGIFIQYAQFQFLMGKAHFCSTASLWAKAFSVSAQHRGCREEFAIILQWVMNPHGSHLQRDPWNFPEEEKAFPCSPAWLDSISSYSQPTCSRHHALAWNPSMLKLYLSPLTFTPDFNCRL